MISKSPELVTFGANLANFCPKSDKGNSVNQAFITRQEEERDRQTDREKEREREIERERERDKEREKERDEKIVERYERQKEGEINFKKWFLISPWC